MIEILIAFMFGIAVGLYIALIVINTDFWRK